MRIILQLIWVFCLAAGLTTCQKEIIDDDLVFEKVPALHIQVQDTMVRGTSYDIHFDYPLANTCRHLSRVDITDPEDLVREITVFVEYQRGDNCTQNYVEKPYVLEFTPAHTGIYILKFWVGESQNGNSEWETYQITVTD